MDDFDLDSFGGDIDFDALQSRLEVDQAAADKAANEEMIELRKGADVCEGGSCTI